MLQMPGLASISGSAPPDSMPNHASREALSAVATAPSDAPDLPDLPPKILLLIMERLLQTRKFKTLLEFVLASKDRHALGFELLAKVPKKLLWIPIMTFKAGKFRSLYLEQEEGALGDYIDQVFSKESNAAASIMPCDCDEHERYDKELVKQFAEELKKRVFTRGNGYHPDSIKSLQSRFVVCDLKKLRRKGKVWLRFRTATNRDGAPCRSFCGIFASEEEANGAPGEPEGWSCACGQNCAYKAYAVKAVDIDRDSWEWPGYY